MFWFAYLVSSVTKVGDWQTEKAKQAGKIYAIVCVSRRENSNFFKIIFNMTWGVRSFPGIGVSLEEISFLLMNLVF
jgi:hypothetical protein